MSEMWIRGHGNGWFKDVGHGHGWKRDNLKMGNWEIWEIGSWNLKLELSGSETWRPAVRDIQLSDKAPMRNKSME